MSETRDAEFDAQICLTAFDILWGRMPAETIDQIEEEMDDNEREVVRRAVSMSVARRLSMGML